MLQVRLQYGPLSFTGLSFFSHSETQKNTKKSKSLNFSVQKISENFGFNWWNDTGDSFHT